MNDLMNDGTTEETMRQEEMQNSQRLKIVPDY